MPPLIQALLDDLQPFGLLWEIIALVLSGGFAWLVAARFRRVWPTGFASNELMVPAIASLAVFTATLWLGRTEPVPLLKLAQVLLFTWLAVRASAGLLLHAFPHSVVLKNVANVGEWVIWFVGVLTVMGLLTPVLQRLDEIKLPFGKPPISVRDVAEAALAAIVTLIIALWLSTVLESRMMKAKSVEMNLRLVFTKVLRAAMLFVAVLVALSVAGIPLTALSVFSGALGVGLGLGLQRLAANYLSGFVILLDGSIKVSDNIRLDGFEGQVTAIRTRYTLVKAPNGRESIVPNETLVTSRVENLSLANTNVLATMTVVCTHDSDVDKALAITVAAAQKAKRVLNEPGPHACISAFVADGLELTLMFWIADPENGLMSLKGEIFREIWRQFQATGIEVPCPEHLKKNRLVNTIANTKPA